MNRLCGSPEWDLLVLYWAQMPEWTPALGQGQGRGGRGKMMELAARDQGLVTLAYS